jgi:hypothetical protein
MDFSWFFVHRSWVGVLHLFVQEKSIATPMPAHFQLIARWFCVLFSQLYPLGQSGWFFALTARRLYAGYSSAYLCSWILIGYQVSYGSMKSNLHIHLSTEFMSWVWVHSQTLTYHLICVSLILQHMVRRYWTKRLESRKQLQILIHMLQILQQC